MEFYIICSILLTHLFLNWKYGSKNILACGLFAFSGREDLTDEQKKTVMAKMKILGMFNQERGTNSCGIAIDDYLVKGVNKESKWTDFIQAKKLGIPVEHNTIIAHTRKSTVGANTEDNAHPFAIFPVDENIMDASLIGAHNGVITNWIELGTKYGVDSTDIKVDSKMLLTCIAHNPDKTVEILESYDGGAALLYYFTERPETLYVFKGESWGKENSYYNSPQVKLEERPLYYLATAEGIYISSLEEALRAIEEDGDGQPVSFKTNNIIAITHGKISTTSFRVKRGDKGLAAPATKSTYTRTRTNVASQDFSKSLLSEEPNPDKSVIKGGKVYFWRGLYWRNGHILGLGRKGSVINNKFQELYLNEDGGIAYQSAITPSTKLYTFWNGRIVKEDKVEEFKKYLNENNTYLKPHVTKPTIEPRTVAYYLSGLVVNADYDGGDARLGEQSVKFDCCEWFTGSFQPLFSNYEYTFSTGSYRGRMLADSKIDVKSVHQIFYECIKPVYSDCFVVGNWDLDDTQDGDKMLAIKVVQVKDQYGRYLGGAQEIKHTFTFNRTKNTIIETSINGDFIIPKFIVKEKPIVQTVLPLQSAQDPFTIALALSKFYEVFDKDDFADILPVEEFNGNKQIVKFTLTPKSGSLSYYATCDKNYHLSYSAELAKFRKETTPTPRLTMENVGQATMFKQLKIFDKATVTKIIDEITPSTLNTFRLLKTEHMGNGIERIRVAVTYSRALLEVTDEVYLCSNEGILESEGSIKYHLEKNPTLYVAVEDIIQERETEILENDYHDKQVASYYLTDETEVIPDEKINEAEEDTASAIKGEIDMCIETFAGIVSEVSDAYDLISLSDVKDEQEVKPILNKLENMLKAAKDVEPVTEF